MNITNDQIHALLDLLAFTKNEEVDCGECWRHMSEFAETNLLGKPIPEGMKCIEEHLRVCGECREEYEVLKAALGNEITDS